ncbi:UNVERIFIED_CONTAM: hypothetical protein GTU68_001195 [Idotea baltica]|nr:hypothetical protein [Idotea baltica]
MVSEEHPHAIIERVVREEWGRVLSILVAQLQDFQLAEDALQDALVSALKQWTPDAGGIPDNPCGWLLRVAKRRMIDQVRRRENFRSKEEQIVASMESADNDPAEMYDQDDAVPDERLRLIFTCCHPALAQEVRVALTLQTLGGLKTAEVARAFVVPESTMAQRLVRAKKKIKTARIPYTVPDAGQLEERAASVLEVLYLIFNEGYAASAGEGGVRADLCDEAIRLAQIFVAIMPGNAESKGLLALMLLHHARSPARADAVSMLVLLEDQDRDLWNRGMIDQGLLILEKALAEKTPGPYQIQAAISALHARSPDHQSTDWQQIYFLYGRLYEWNRSPVVRLNAIVALSYAGGPEAALVALNEVRHDGRLQSYLPLHATEADLHRRVGDKPNAIAAYRRALALAEDGQQRAFLEQRLSDLAGDSDFA